MSVLNNVILLITQIRLSIAQANSSFNRLDRCTPTHATPTVITEASTIVVFNDCFSGLMPYTVLANS